MLKDYQRTGIGEQGFAASLGNSGNSKLLEEQLFRQHGLNALLSDAISVNRSIRDLRDQRCLHKKYLRKLPSISVVISFHNELLSTFCRTLHSLINRTPPELLKEIILVDDFSDSEFFLKLENYVAENIPKVQFVRLPERLGLIQGRLAGIRKMTAEVLVISDAHIEFTHNWLPPLLEPLVLNRRTITCPHIDWIDAKSLHYRKSALHKGSFSWNMAFQFLDLRPAEILDASLPFKNPVMTGCIFAISIDYFWELGGYDEGLEIWGGEQYELSFKTWMCGGQILNVPCSRVGHHYRGILDKGMHTNNKDYYWKNTKRVADVWMDEYGKYVYEHSAGRMESIDAGDLTQRKALREELHCKPFNWYMQGIAADILKRNPPIEPFEYATGAIQSVAQPQLCIDSFNSATPGLYQCAQNLSKPHQTQLFSLRWSHDIRRGSRYCLDVPNMGPNATVILFSCHNEGGTQFWYYDRKHKLLKHGLKGIYCLEAAPSKKKIFLNKCQMENLNMKWIFGKINATALDKFFENKNK